MTSLRSIGYLLFLAVTVILYALTIGILGWILPYRFVARSGQYWGQVNLAAVERICGLGYRIEGKENLPSKTCIVMCKHQSAWETIALRALLPPAHTWVVKRELLWLPFFGWAMAPFRPIAINRKSGRGAMRKLLHEGSHWLKKGRWVVVFPEGTRVAPGQRKPYSQGGAILARSTGYPVVPIAHNAGVFWRRRGMKKYPGQIRLIIGEPIEAKDRSVIEISNAVEEWIEGTVARLPQKRAD